MEPVLEETKIKRGDGDSLRSGRKASVVSTEPKILTAYT